MAIEDSLLRALCAQTLVRTDLQGIGEREEGKVRDNYMAAGRRTIVVTDRVSCFDVVVGTIPLKGQVLNRLAAFWFEKTQALAPNHLIEVPDANVSVVRELRILPVEFVVRGYLTGVSPTSIWTAYERGERSYCGHQLPEGLAKHEALPEPLLTPTTKAARGEHDELTSRAEILSRGLVSEELYDKAAQIAAKLFAAGSEWAAQRGMILADTKYEMGLDENGALLLADEIHTPDSSRYWFADSYQRALREGGDPKSFDKEFVRRWLVSEHNWRGEGPPPTLPDEVRCEAARRYLDAYAQLTGAELVPDTDPPEARIAEALLASAD
ncbi:MAG: phosphoribosylaminoimidazolesuccinocarboxamide synthase [Deltaproteobacteria bacterium]|nr:phosphoribosylaminoimidazolesuccinocarboxamide synthase [Deltaproteobacteria bacterium]